MLSRVATRAIGAALACCLACGPGVAAEAVGSADSARWHVAGRQGMMIHVIVPGAQARDRDAYARQTEWICAGRETCFVNFYTNSTGAETAIPLPDAISAEATAVLRRSAKQGTEGFRWSCRMAIAGAECF